MKKTSKTSKTKNTESIKGVINEPLKEVIQPVITSNITKDEKKEIKELVKLETFKQMVSVNHLQELTIEQKQIAKSVSKGLEDFEIIEKHKISQTYLETLHSNPKFVQEVKSLTYNDSRSFANQDRRVQMISRISDMLFEDLIKVTPEQLAEISPDKKMKMLKEFTEVMEKSVGENKNVKVDITVALQDKIKSANASVIKDDKTGEITIKSAYPVINNETGKIESENASDYIFEDESSDNV